MPQASQPPGVHRFSATGRVRRTATMIVLVALLALVWTAGPAAAHTDLDSTTPSNGGTVDSLDAVTLRFASPVLADFGSVLLTTEGDQPVPLSEPTVVDETMTATLAGPPPGPGLYIVTYRAVAADGHPITGSFAFTLEQAGATAAPARPTDTTTTSSEDAAAVGGTRAGVVILAALAVALLIGLGLWLSVRRRTRL